jgi:hypothetical protein
MRHEMNNGYYGVRWGLTAVCGTINANGSIMAWTLKPGRLLTVAASQALGNMPMNDDPTRQQTSLSDSGTVI